MNPIFISSPVRRSGTTLLQRLLCSAPNTLIFGESCVHEFSFFISTLHSRKMVFGQNKEWRNQQLSSVLDGQVNDWFPDLMPEIEGYLSAFTKGAMSVFEHYKNFAEENNRPIWGAKLPEWQIFSLIQVFNFLPESKIVYLDRELTGCFRSAKAIQMINGMEDARYFCNTWKQNRKQAFQHLTGERVLHIDYDDLMSKPIEVIKKIELFTGAKGIDTSVLNYKINNYIDTSRDLEIGYLKPEKLDQEELDLIDEILNN